MGVRRAFVWASTARYVNLALNLTVTLFLARVLAPSEYGVAVLGSGIFAVAEALRALGGGAYLIQKQELSTANVRACFSVSLTTTLLVTVALLLLARGVAGFFAVPRLARYIHVAALGYAMGPFISPIAALLGRDMAFGRLALISTASAAVNAGVSVTLAVAGFSYLSFAWAGAAATAASMLLSVLLWKDRSIFRPTGRGWRSVLGFGLYDSATAVVSQVADALPAFIFGRLLNTDAVGIGQRAVMLCFAPERVILAGVGAVALPAFAQHTRNGLSLRPVYLRAIELITAAQWPSLMLLAVLAQPLVVALLGTQWLAVIPLVRILAVAMLMSFPITLHYPTVVAVGAIRYMPAVMVVQSVASLAVFTAAARHGLMAAVLSSLLILPCNGLLALFIAKHFIGFRWQEMLGATRRSLGVTGLSVVGPAVLVTLLPVAARPLGMASAGVFLGGVGWLLGLRMTRHPLLDEMRRLTVDLRATAAVTRLLSAAQRIFQR